MVLYSFAITEYDGFGRHSYFNVTVGRRQVRPLLEA
jgi:hypothetical protein